VSDANLGASWDEHFIESKKDALLGAKISKMMELELDRRRLRQKLPPSPHDTEILHGSTEAPLPSPLKRVALPPSKGVPKSSQVQLTTSLQGSSQPHHWNSTDYSIGSEIFATYITHKTAMCSL
jgi:hypothetical protein